MGIADLESLIGPSREDVPPIEWASIEEALGFRLPFDYKWLMQAYSTIEFDDFLLVQNISLLSTAEVGSIKTRQLSPLAEVTARGERRVTYLHDGTKVRGLPSFPLYPAEGGLLQWGATTNGDRLLWRTIGSPDEWSIVVTDDGIYWFEYSSNMTDFLTGWIRREIVTHVLSGEFPRAPAIRQEIAGSEELVPTPMWVEYFEQLDLDEDEDT